MKVFVGPDVERRELVPLEYLPSTCPIERLAWLQPAWLQPAGKTVGSGKHTVARPASDIYRFGLLAAAVLKCPPLAVSSPQ